MAGCRQRRGIQLDALEHPAQGVLARCADPLQPLFCTCANGRSHSRAYRACASAWPTDVPVDGGLSDDVHAHGGDAERSRPTVHMLSGRFLLVAAGAAILIRHPPSSLAGDRALLGLGSARRARLVMTFAVTNVPIASTSWSFILFQVCSASAPSHAPSARPVTRVRAWSTCACVPLRCCAARCFSAPSSPATRRTRRRLPALGRPPAARSGNEAAVERAAAERSGGDARAGG